MKTELDIIADISSRFEHLAIPFMLTGSIAMNYYAEPRMTRNIDVVIMLQAEDVKKLVSKFAGIITLIRMWSVTILNPFPEAPSRFPQRFISPESLE